MSTAIIASLVILIVGWSALHVSGDAGSQTDPTGDTVPGTATPDIDVTEVRHADDGLEIAWSFHTANTFDPEAGSLDTAQWNLDLNSNGIYNEPSDACIQLQPLLNGSGIMRASLRAGCAGAAAGTADAEFTGGNDVTIAFDNAFIRGATGFAGASYRYQFVTSDFASEVDTVPNTGHIDHTSVAQVGDTPEPTTTGTAATTTPSTSTTPGATSTPDGTADPTSTPTATPCPTPTPTPTPTATAEATATPTATATATAEATSTPTATPTDCPEDPDNTANPDSTSSPGSNVSAEGASNSAGSGAAGGTLSNSGLSVLGYLLAAAFLLVAGLELLGIRTRRSESK